MIESGNGSKEGLVEILGSCGWARLETDDLDVCALAAAFRENIHPCLAIPTHLVKGVALALQRQPKAAFRIFTGDERGHLIGVRSRLRGVRSMTQFSSGRIS